MDRLRNFVIANLVNHVTTTIETTDANALSMQDGANTEQARDRATDDSGPIDLGDIASTFLLHARALDHIARVDDTFVALYRWLATRMSEEELREFAEEYSIITRITRATGDREEFFGALNAFVEARQDVEAATETNETNQTTDSKRDLHLKALALERARARVRTWAELLVITLDELAVVVTHGVFWGDNFPPEA